MNNRVILPFLLIGLCIFIVPDSLTEGASVTPPTNEAVCISSTAVESFAISGDGKWIAFNKDGYHETFYIIPSGGGAETTLTLPPEAHHPRSFAWSHDSEWIYFLGYNTTGTYEWNLWKIHPDGSNRTLVLGHGAHTTFGSFSLAPDDNRIVFANMSENRNQLCLIDIAGESVSSLLVLPNATHRVTNHGIDWSPDGNQIIFCAKYESNGSLDLKRVNADGTGLTRILGYRAEEEALVHPEWSPDGAHLLCWIGSGTVTEPTIWAVQLDISHIYPVLAGYRYPKWFPNGSKIAMIGYTAGGGAPDGLYILDVPSPFSAFDTDGDGLSNYEEYLIYNTDYDFGDTDGDGLGDGIEVRLGWNPNFWDSDSDGIGDGVEFATHFGGDTTATALPDGFIQINLLWSSYQMQITSNSTMLSAAFNQDTKELSFEVEGEAGTHALCNITLPLELIEDISRIQILVDGAPLSFVYTILDETVTLSFEYTHSTHEVSVLLNSLTLPHPPSPLILLAIAGVLVVLVVISIILILRRKGVKINISIEKSVK